MEGYTSSRPTHGPPVGEQPPLPKVTSQTVADKTLVLGNIGPVGTSQLSWLSVLLIKDHKVLAMDWSSVLESSLIHKDLMGRHGSVFSLKERKKERKERR